MKEILMATRSTTSEYQPSPPVNRFNRGKVVGRLAHTSTPGVKANMGCPPTQESGQSTKLTPITGS